MPSFGFNFVDRTIKFYQSEINILLEVECEINKILHAGGEINKLSSLKTLALVIEWWPPKLKIR